MQPIDSEPAAGPLFLGIDVGGTNVKLGVVDAAGRLCSKTTAATPPLRTPERVFAHALEFALTQLRQWSLPPDQLVAVGLAVPGVLDSRQFVLREVVNLPGWIDQPLLKILATTCGRTAAVVNDANAAAYAEHALRDLGDQSLALITLGTGVGCGVVVGGRPYGGDHGCAGELGHMAIDFTDDAIPCTCGSRGHLESYAGSGGVIARLKAAIALAGPTAVAPHLLEDDLTPRDIAEQAAVGCPVCQGVIDATATYVGRAIGLVGQVIDPAVVLLGGAMNFGGTQTAIGRGFLQRVRQTVRQTTLVQVGENLVVDFATLGNDAGVLGAAMVAKQAYEK